MKGYVQSTRSYGNYVETEDRTKSTVKAKDRSTITEEEAKLERWRVHFQQLINRCDPPTLVDICEAEQDLDIELGPITVQVKDAITKLKNGKAPEDDNVYAEMLKAVEQETPQIHQRILQDV